MGGIARGAYSGVSSRGRGGHGVATDGGGGGRRGGPEEGLLGGWRDGASTGTCTGGGHAHGAQVLALRPRHPGGESGATR